MSLVDRYALLLSTALTATVALIIWLVWVLAPLGAVCVVLGVFWLQNFISACQTAERVLRDKGLI